MFIKWLKSIHRFYGMKKIELRRWKCRKKAMRTITKYGVDLRVNNPCFFSGHVVVGDHCNFNGMRILGEAVRKPNMR